MREALKRNLRQAIFELGQKADDTQDPALAMVGHSAIRRSQFLYAFEKHTPKNQHRLIQEDGRKELLNRIINQRLLAIEAERLGIDRSPETRAKLSVMRDGILSEALRSRMAPVEFAVTDTEIEDYFNTRPKEFLERTDIRLTQVYSNSMSEAKQIEMLLKTKAAGNVAKAVSMAPAGTYRVVVSTLTIGAIAMTEIEKTAASLPVGKASGVLRSGQEYLVLRKDAQSHHPARKLAEVRDDISRKLARRKENELLARIKKNLGVTTNEEALAVVGWPTPKPYDPNKP